MVSACSGSTGSSRPRSTDDDVRAPVELEWTRNPTSTSDVDAPRVTLSLLAGRLDVGRRPVPARPGGGRRADGTAEVTLPVAALPWLARLLLRLGRDAEVITVDHASDEVADGHLVVEDGRGPSGAGPLPTWSAGRPTVAWSFCDDQRAEHRPAARSTERSSVPVAREIPGSSAAIVPDTDRPDVPVDEQVASEPKQKPSRRPRTPSSRGASRSSSPSSPRCSSGSSSFEQYSIPSASMIPTLEIGDRVLVSKLNRTPGRGDMVVFTRPSNDPPQSPPTIPRCSSSA